MTLLGSLFLLLTSCGLLLVKHATAVTELTDSNFFDYAKDKDVLLVDFYAPWCSDCKALDPDFENAALTLGSRSVDLAKVDCFGAGKGLCSTYGVKQWPTLKNFNRGQYTGDYSGGLTTADIAGYIATVENSVHPVVNPYAAMAVPQRAAAVTQQCVAKCKISRITNKQPCYARCKPKSYGKKVALPQPVINEKSCAKCRQPQIAGKYSRHCSSLSVRRACISRRHRSHKVRKASAKLHSTGPSTPDTSDTTSKKATIGTLTSATNDNVLKLSLSEPLIVPPNAEHRKPREEELYVRESKTTSPAYDPNDIKVAQFDSTPVTENSDGSPTADDGDKKNDLSEREQMLKLINDADDKKKPVLSLPQHDKYIQIPPHDSGDKKMGMQRASKSEKQVKYPLPKVPAKALKANEKVKFAPKFLTLKVPPHDSGDFKAPPGPKPAANYAVPYASPKMAHKQGFVTLNKNMAQRIALAKRLRAANMQVKLAPGIHQAQANPKLQRPNLDNKMTHAQLTKNMHHPNAGPPFLPLAHPLKPAIKKGLVKITPILRNGTGLILSSPLPMKEQVPVDKIVALNRVGPITSQRKKLETMTPREALKVPYDADDKKRTLD